MINFNKERALIVIDSICPDSFMNLQEIKKKLATQEFSNLFLDIIVK